ncbi:MAG: S8 family peptidase [Rhodocyclaceae bacterium]
MPLRALLLYVLVAVLSYGCATRFPEPADAAATAQMREAPNRLIVIAVANRTESFPLRAGSTPGGYGMVRPYTSTGSARATVAALASEYGLREVAGWPIDVLKVHCVVLEIIGPRSRDELLDALADDPRVSLAQPLQSFDTLGAAYNDPYFDLQYGLKDIEALGAQRVSHAESVRIALIDTGVDTQHPDLLGRIALARDFVERTPTSFDQDRHGTEVAGVIAANVNNHAGIVGVAPGAQIMAFKACWPLTERNDGSSRCNSFTLAQGIVAAIDAGAQIINLSLGGPPDPLLTKLVAQSIGRGIVVVGAVPPNADMSGFPVGVPGVIAVDTAGRAPSAPQVLLAPGKEILTLRPGGNYDFSSGSSLATAHVTGTVALMLATEPRLDPPTIHALLNESSGSDSSKPNVINACKAMAALRSNDCTHP